MKHIKLGWTIKIEDLSVLIGVPERVSCQSRDGFFVVKSGGTIRVDPYKRILKQFDTPNIMKKFIGLDMSIERNYLDPEEGELFRIYINNHTIDNSKPYFTSSHLNIPRNYIGNRLDERSMALMASFARTTTGMIENGVLQIFLTETKQPLSHRLYISGRQLRCNVSTAMKRIIGQELCEFDYERTLDVSPHYKYGVMEFRRRPS